MCGRTRPPNSSSPAPRDLNLTSIYDKCSGSMKLLHAWIMSVIAKKQMVQSGHIDGPAEYLSYSSPPTRGSSRTGRSTWDKGLFPTILVYGELPRVSFWFPELHGNAWELGIPRSRDQSTPRVSRILQMVHLSHTYLCARLRWRTCQRPQTHQFLPNATNSIFP